MRKADIFCKIELIKDKNSGNITLTAHLNPQAPNVFTDEHTISWTPTFEEQTFLIDAILLLNKQQKKPIVTFSKKKSQSVYSEAPETPESIESINQTIDNLPVASKDMNHFSANNGTIEQIIKQKSKD
jgi:hypothetical protein